MDGGIIQCLAIKYIGMYHLWYTIKPKWEKIKALKLIYQKGIYITLKVIW